VNQVLNVLIVSQYFYPERFIINEVALDLARLGHRVTVLTGMPNYPDGRLFAGYLWPWIRRERYQTIDVIRVPIIPRGKSAFQLVLNYFSYAAAASVLAAVLVPKQVDVVLVYEPSPITVGIPAIAVKLVKRSPILLWVQDLWPETLLAVGAVRSPHIINAVRKLVRFIYGRSDVILAQSKAFIDKIHALAPPNADVRYFPNPADSFYRPIVLPADAPERELLRPGFQVICAGNMGAAQNLDVVIGAAERLRHRTDIQWSLIGDGAARRWVEEQIQERDLHRTVQVIGPFPSEKMPALLSLADVLLATLRKDDVFALTIPSRIQSYLASGRPILAAIEGEGARIVKEAMAGASCPPGDPDQLAEAIETFYQKPVSEREAMGRAGRDYFEREFDRDVLMGRLDAWLRAAVEKANGLNPKAAAKMES
jgi:glycosyltransferase involved in cell wall biosynthesis